MNAIEKKCLTLLSELDDTDQKSVLSFAEFLLEKAKKEGRFLPIEEPLNIPRPAEERVIAAIKRLSKTYPMIKKDTLLDETSLLMSAHLLKGRAAAEVIDDLEVLFQKHYKKLLQSRTN